MKKWSSHSHVSGCADGEQGCKNDREVTADGFWINCVISLKSPIANAVSQREQLK